MRVDELSRLIITEITAVYTRPTRLDEFHRVHRSDTWKICFFSQGEAEYFCEGRWYVATSDSVIIIPEGCDYRYQCTKAGQIYVVEFQTFNSPADHRLCRIWSKNKEETVRIFSKVLEIKNSNRPVLECMTRFYTLLKMILDHK